MFEKAITLDPQYAEAYALLGMTYGRQWGWGWSTDPQTLERALAMAQRAVALDDSLPRAHNLLGRIYLQKKQYGQALAEVERALALDPNNADGYMHLGMILTYVGQPQEGLTMTEKAMRLNPHSPVWYLDALGWRYYGVGRSEEAIAAFKRALARSPNAPSARLGLTAAYGALGREAEARTEAAEFLRLTPNFSLEVHRQWVPFKDPAALERHLDHLRKAGLR
jgi:adenylate cyclase